MTLPRYPAYKDSGVEWLGEVPEHWEVRRLRDLGTVTNGFPFDSSRFDPVEGIPLVRIRDICSGETVVRWGGEPVAAAEIGDGDVLIGMDGDFNVAWWSGGYAMLNQRVCCVRMPASEDQRLVFFALPIPLSRINDLTYSTTVKHLSSFEVERIRMAWGSPDERRHIATFLNHETSKIDALIAEQQNLIALLKEKRQAVISHAVTKGLNPDVPMKDSGVEWLGGIPKHWDEFRLSKFCGFVQGKAHEPYFDEGGSFVCVTARFVSTNGEQRKYCNENLSPAMRNDIVMVMSDLPSGRALARAILIDQDEIYAVNQRVCAITVRNGNPRFFLYQLDRNPQLLQYDDGSNQTHLPNRAFTKLVMRVPPLIEQDEIAGFLDYQVRWIDELVCEARKAINFLQERRSALISAAVTGKIDIRSLVSQEAA